MGHRSFLCYDGRQILSNHIKTVFSAWTFNLSTKTSVKIIISKMSQSGIYRVTQTGNLKCILQSHWEMKSYVYNEYRLPAQGSLHHVPAGDPRRCWPQ